MAIPGEETAMQVRERLGLKQRVDVEEVARQLNIDVCNMEFQGKKVQEITIGRNIYVRNGMPQRKRRWVVAHGIGHSLMHSDQNQVFLHTMDSTRSIERHEQQAESFARRLLLGRQRRRHFGDNNDAEAAAFYGLPLEKIGPRPIRGCE